MTTDEISNTTLDKNGNVVYSIEKEKIMQILADSIPQNTRINDVLKGGLLFIADIIHQMDPENNKRILDASKGLLECEYHIIQKKFKENNLKS
jgi:hypothetical protein